MIRLTRESIDTQELLANVAGHSAGASVLFVGTTRNFTAGRETARLEYDCYPDMAEAKLHELRTQAMAQWPLVGCAIVHRLGPVELGEASVAIAVSSPHRQDALTAAQWLIDTLKAVVPIWKKENWADGTSEWVHPGMNTADHSQRENGK